MRGSLLASASSISRVRSVEFPSANSSSIEPSNACACMAATASRMWRSSLKTGTSTLTSTRAPGIGAGSDTAA